MVESYPLPLRGRVRVGVNSSHEQPRYQVMIAIPVNPLILLILIQTKNRKSLGDPPKKVESLRGCLKSPLPLRGRFRVGVNSSHEPPLVQAIIAIPVNPLIPLILIQTKIEGLLGIKRERSGPPHR